MMISLSDQRVIALDTETNGLTYKINRPFGFSVATEGWSGYFDERRDDNCIDWLKDELKKYKGLIVLANASFDAKMLESWNIDLMRNNVDDVIVRMGCIDEHLPTYSLDFMTNKYLGHGKEVDLYKEIAEYLKLGRCTRQRAMSHISEIPPDMIDEYARVDAVLTLDLWHWQEKEIKRQGIEQIIEFERSRIPMFIRAERRGIRVDTEYAEQAMDKLTPLIDGLQSKLDSLSGITGFNCNSSPQVKLLFNITANGNEFYTSEGVKLPKTPKGNPSLGSEVLRDMDTPLSNTILDQRSLLKTRDTFLAKHVLEHNHKGRVYPNINQTKGDEGGTGTGRLSYTNPAMQQIPNRNKEVAAVVKRCFLPDEGMTWVDSDMNGFEVRVFAHLTNNAKIIKEYQENPLTDFHQYVGDISGLPRNATYPGEANAKQLNLSMIFNSGDGAIAEKMGMPFEWTTFTTRQGEVVTYKKPGIQAKEVIATYHSRVTGVKELMEKAKRIALSRGHIVSKISGRRIRFPDKRYVYKASGLLTQTTSADLNKENWSIIEEQLDGVGHLILNTHDSYSMCLPHDWEEHYKRVKNEIEKPRLRVPLILDLNGSGSNWWDAIK